MNSKPFGCVGNTMRVSTGRYFDLANPHPGQFEFVDIANALSKICRFGGHVPMFYSVAEHSWNCWQQAVADKLTLPERIAVLMHDATEAFCGDVVKPLKIMLPEYAVIEKRVENVVAEKFGIDFEKHAAVVSKIDHEMLIAERNAILGRDREWQGENGIRQLIIRPQYWGPERAAMKFADAADQEGFF